MSTLESVILDQHSRVAEVTPERVDIVLAEMQGEILSVATPEATLAILENEHQALYPDYETMSSTVIMREQMSSRSPANRLRNEARIAFGPSGIAEIGFVTPQQGYTGGILFDGDERIIHGHSSIPEGIKEEDPIQDAMGETFYPPMMWVKALRAEAYRRRPESAQSLSIALWLAEHGLSLGSAITKHGDIVGATGFMPDRRMIGTINKDAIRAHVASEVEPSFRLSGICDQAVLDPDILFEPAEFAQQVIDAGGSIN